MNDMEWKIKETTSYMIMSVEQRAAVEILVAMIQANGNNPVPQMSMQERLPTLAAKMAKKLFEEVAKNEQS